MQQHKYQWRHHKARKAYKLIVAGGLSLLFKTIDHSLIFVEKIFSLLIVAVQSVHLSRIHRVVVERVEKRLVGNSNRGFGFEFFPCDRQKNHKKHETQSRIAPFAVTSEIAKYKTQRYEHQVFVVSKNLK